MRQVLLVDDDDLFAEFVTDAAELVGAIVTAIDNGQEIEQQDLSKFDDIILDLTIPGYDGVQLLRWLKDRNCNARIIIASGCEASVLNSAKQLAESYGLNLIETLAKPFSLDAFLHALRKGDNQEEMIGLRSGSKPVDEIDEQELITQLEAAINNNEIQIYYQPRFALSDNKLLGFEALSRWIKVDGSSIPPTIFIPIAEKFDLIDTLTRNVVEKVVAQLAEWNRKGIELHGSFNFSARSLNLLDFPDYLTELIEQHGILPSQLIVELTESALAEDEETSLEILTRLRMKGFSLSIDDFGTGYSSVQQLQNIPFNELKIDRSFVASYQNNQSRTIIASTIEMAHKLGIMVIAEGIEDQKTIDYLIEAGCDQGQGFYYAKPMSADDFTKWMKANQHYVSSEPFHEGDFKICAVDDDLDFIEIMADVLSQEFNFTSFTSARQFLDQYEKVQPDILLLDVNLPSIDGFEVCRQIKEFSHQCSVIFISGADTKEQRLKAYAAGGDDFVGKPIAMGELLAKLRTLRKFQVDQESLTNQEAEARDMAFQSMTEAAQYGSLLRFFKDSFHCKNHQQLAELFFNIMGELQLTACIQFRSPYGKHNYRSATQDCSPMEANLFEMLIDAGRLYHFKTRTMVNDKHVSFLIKNMPVEDEILYGRYNDLIAALIEGLEAKWFDLNRDKSTSELVHNIDEVLAVLQGKFDQFEKETHEIIDMLILDVRSSLHVLDLSEEQENYLIGMIEKGVERVVELGDSGREIEGDFKEIITRFKAAYS